MPVTRSPSRTRSVTPAHPASVVIPSKHSPGPSPYIGWKWSNPQTPSKPRVSANRTRSTFSSQVMRCWATSSPKRMPLLVARPPRVRHRGGRVLAVTGPVPDDERMQIALALYPRFTALDIVGPFQTVVDVPGVDACFVAETAGPVTDHTGRLSLTATRAFGDVTAPDVIVVPGGMVEPSGADDPVVAWIRAVHPTTTWTTSVCTGSLFLAAAGVLDGVDATGHWAAMELLAALGACPTGTRVVERGKVITAAGVSAGIDMGLTLVARMFGDDMAR